ncbi:glutathione S-transferase [Poronia punctata]|nr:glutathione S-transferase [Poronia punctata]
MLPIKLYNGRPGSDPNPWKVALVLSELKVPYRTEWLDYDETKEQPFLSLNPNGRLPAIVDPNKNVTLFESGAIINYLIDTYDPYNKLTYGKDRPQERYLVQSWLMFQTSKQGPMFGQKMRVALSHAEENLTTATKRYSTETKRICIAIDGALRDQRKKLDLSEQGTVWLVGDHYTFADLSFVPWNVTLLREIGNKWEDELPEFYKWHNHLVALPEVRRVLDLQTQCMQTMRNTAADVWI